MWFKVEMSSFGLRPSFSHEVEQSLEAAQARLVARMQEAAPGFEIKSFPGFICLRIPERERHFWTPRLNLSLDAEGDGRTKVTGTYGPNATMWGSFLYGYLFLGCLGMFAGIFGYCQWRLGMTAWGLWIFWTTAAIGAGLYLAAQMGQKLAAQQTFTLHRIYEEAAERSITLQ